MIFALNCAGIFSAEPESDDPQPTKTTPWITAQEKGIVKGVFVPSKHGIYLPPNAKIMVIPVNDEGTSKNNMIDEWQALFVQRRLKAAERAKFDLIILEIDTHGGEVEACKRIVTDIENCKVPVVAFVKNKAWSGGALLSLGCKMIIMEPNSEIGSAKVVLMGGDFEVAMRQKQDGVMRAIVRNLCDQNGHSHAIAQGMVDSSIEVLETTDPNQRFMTDTEFATAAKRGITVKGTLKQKNQILALNAADAVKSGLAVGTAAGIDEIALGMGAPSAQITRMEISSAEILARFLSNPIWRVLLVIIALVGLFWEMSSPGHGVGYAVFAFGMGMFFWLQIFSHNAGIFELLLFGLGAVLVAVELFILPTFGALGFAGITMVIVSIILAFLPEGSMPGLLGYSGKPTEYLMRQVTEGMEWATLTLLTIMGFFALVWWKGITLPGFNRMALTTVNSGTARGGSASSATMRAIEPGLGAKSGSRLSALVGLVGQAETMLRPAGKIRLEGATYDAVSEGGFIEPGRVVYVLRAQGSALVVRLSSEKTDPVLER